MKRKIKYKKINLITSLLLFIFYFSISIKQDKKDFKILVYPLLIITTLYLLFFYSKIYRN